ncbi:hypothetical protein [Clostridium vincentii]|uniref:Uncharacterized protein n=1 Tax=Clostridium vincentii TaxID=52704 RepID=A0A2T0BDE4_9CLOT|nr:hypothetical protein [Clostridium vincentii]PRR81827.1 hypothetical protein CLVI_21730 [Clostridium vincentii]
MIYILYLLALITIYTISFLKSKHYLELRIQKIMIRIYSISIVVFSIIITILAVNQHYEIKLNLLVGAFALFLGVIPCNIFNSLVMAIKNSKDKN